MPCVCAERVPAAPGGSHQEEKAIVEGSLRWGVISAAGELWSGLKRNEMGHPQHLLPWQTGQYFKIQPRKTKGILESTPQKFCFTLEWDGHQGKSTFFFFFSPPPFLFSWMSQPVNWLPEWWGLVMQFNPKDWVVFEPMKVKTYLPWADVCLLINNAHWALTTCQALSLQAIHALSRLLFSATFRVPLLVPF